MVAFVGDQVAGAFRCRGEVHRRKILLRLFQRRLEGRGVALVSGVGRRVNDDPGVEIDCVFGLEARWVVPSFILAILASGSVGLVQSSFDSFLPLRLRSSRMRSSIVGVAIAAL